MIITIQDEQDILVDGRNLHQLTDTEKQYVWAKALDLIKEKYDKSLLNGLLKSTLVTRLGDYTLIRRCGKCGHEIGEINIKL